MVSLDGEQELAAFGPTRDARGCPGATSGTPTRENFHLAGDVARGIDGERHRAYAAGGTGDGVSASAISHSQFQTQRTCVNAQPAAIGPVSERRSPGRRGTRTTGHG